MKKIKKVLSLMLASVMIFSVVFSSSMVTAEAAVTAKSLVKSALKYMEKYDTITYTYNSNRNINGELRNRRGMETSDAKIEHGFYLDDSQSQDGWEEYRKKDKVYRKSYSDTQWTIYTDTDYDSASDGTCKKNMQYMLGHLKNLKIVSRGQKSYTVTAKPNYSDTNVKNITLTIDKKKKCITKIKRTYKNYINTYYNSTDTYTVKNQVVTWSNIGYGKGNISLPAGL